MKRDAAKPTRLRRARQLAIAVLVSAAGLLPAHAHHDTSFYYDAAQSVRLTGLITEFRFVEPHVLIYVAVESMDGTTVIWSAGLASSSELASSEGWTENTFQAGDRVTLIGSPAIGGAPSIVVSGLFDANGISRLRSE